MKYYIVYSYTTDVTDTIRQGMRIVGLDHKMRESDIFKIQDALKREGKYHRVGITFFALLEEEPKDEPKTGEIIPCTL